MADVITVLGIILTAIMGIGAVTGAMNTMYAAVSQRQREIGCLLAMGFTPESVWLAFMLEALGLSLLGAVLGCAGAMLFNGMKTGTTNWMSFSETAFEFTVTPQILLIASLIALLMGFIGGMLPAPASGAAESGRGAMTGLSIYSLWVGGVDSFQKGYSSPIIQSFSSSDKETASEDHRHQFSAI